MYSKVSVPWFKIGTNLEDNTWGLVHSSQKPNDSEIKMWTEATIGQNLDQTPRNILQISILNQKTLKKSFDLRPLNSHSLI